MSNDLILSLETATRSGSLALTRGESVITSSTGIADESHSVNLLSRIESLLDEAHIKLSDVDLFAVASGPGSFTGLRIGLATMKAFAATFDRPCIGVPTLEAIAFAAGPAEFTYALLPAGRGEVFALGTWAGRLNGPRASRPPGPRASRPHCAPNTKLTSGVDAGVTGERLAAPDAGETPAVPTPDAGETPAVQAVPTPALHLPPQVLLDGITNVSSIHWAGPGAHLYRDLIEQRAAALGIHFVEGIAKNPDREWTLAPNEDKLAVFVAILALQRANKSEHHRAEDLRAIYVRPSDAELTRI